MNSPAAHWRGDFLTIRWQDFIIYRKIALYFAGLMLPIKKQPVAINMILII